ncbi:hypothetical protein PC129_g6020 [Phytophthora cactorum]|uniref:Uncharacterized protein n=1 Tax=Phytophthora cactorum TaxID=29920 RepID=A0A329SJN1_9STRA|nr:hypothetical protein PC112_g8326 [Phytophthora cactorum]KAG2831691.1 hypothetical protein PC111_g6914 [Phytophthora cactorum]KAG2859818.1 hypothetical protein PC113_g8588 [Phytophthora cactorum]KAG2927246.1 hypothetical protein PC115_g7617 [Phytophthora cactorum]KAG2936604.1 hypothetical protein PC114_g165 [Phytophthora cactorum]
MGDDDGGDVWEEDWNIGEMSDEDSDVEQEALPESVWSSIAKDNAGIKLMKTGGWEYDAAKFGGDPTYSDLYDGLHGPIQSVLSAVEDPLALLFYFMLLKL